MNESLVSNMVSLYNISSTKLKKYDSSKFIVQSKNDTCQADEKSLPDLTDDADEVARCITMMHTKSVDEYVLVAYHDGKIFGCTRKL